MNEEYNEALEWAANWIIGSQMLGRSQEVVEFAQSMAMSLRAAKRPTSRAVDEGDSAPLQAESTPEVLPIEEADTTPALRN